MQIYRVVMSSIDTNNGRYSKDRKICAEEITRLLNYKLGIFLLHRMHYCHAASPTWRIKFLCPVSTIWVCSWWFVSAMNLRASCIWGWVNKFAIQVSNKSREVVMCDMDGASASRRRFACGSSYFSWTFVLIWSGGKGDITIVRSGFCKIEFLLDKHDEKHNDRDSR